MATFPIETRVANTTLSLGIGFADDAAIASSEWLHGLPLLLAVPLQSVVDP
jgi:hypothetical protein